jgi:hypothetical protein
MFHILMGAKLFGLMVSQFLAEFWRSVSTMTVVFFWFAN